MDMPDIVSRYFDADNKNDADALMSTFALNAVVEDENVRHQDGDAIREWWLAAKKATQYVSKPLESCFEGDKALVRASVSGEFPGSPLLLTHTFTCMADKIVRLEIRP